MLFRDLSCLIVDDDPFISQLLAQVLDVFNVGEVHSVGSCDDAIDVLRKTPIDCIFVDWMMRPKTGMELVEYVRRNDASPNQEMPLILVSAYTDIDRILEARDKGITEVLAKPFSPTHVYAKLSAAILKPRAFVSSDVFVGPDRRRRNDDYDGEERRGKHSMSQEQIDTVMSEADKKAEGESDKQDIPADEPAE